MSEARGPPSIRIPLTIGLSLIVALLGGIVSGTWWIAIQSNDASHTAAQLAETIARLQQRLDLDEATTRNDEAASRTADRQHAAELAAVSERVTKVESIAQYLTTQSAQAQQSMAAILTAGRR